MHAQQFDFYQGFDGEPELIVECRVGGRVTVSVRAWIGYLDQVLAMVEPGDEGWAGLAKQYHLLGGWNGGEWVDPYPGHSLEQLKSARERLDAGTARDFASRLIALISNCDDLGGEIAWRLE